MWAIDPKNIKLHFEQQSHGDSQTSYARYKAIGASNPLNES